MPSDLITLRPLCAEINRALSGGKVDKLAQPEADEVRLNVRNAGKNYALVMSCNPCAPRIHLTTSKKENPYTAPSFCMLLRKYLIGSEIIAVEILEDRIFRLRFKCKTELKDIAEYRLYIEIMNRYSNIIFTNSQDIIQDAIKKFSFDEGKRGMFAGIKYIPPIQSCKISLYDIESVKKLVLSANIDSLSGILTKNLNGVSKTTVNEIINRAGKTIEVTDEFAQKVADIAAQFYDIFHSSDYNPCNKTANNDFYIAPYASEQAEWQSAPSLNEAADIYFSSLDKNVRVKDKSKNLVSAAKKFTDKTEKKIKLAEQKLAECADAETVRQKGDLITANLHLIKRGDKQIIVDNFYDENYEKIKIQLDEKLSPQKNAQAMYQKYTKLKRGAEAIAKQLKIHHVEYNYILSILDELSRADTDCLPEIERELIKIGALRAKKQSGKVREPKPSTPDKYEYEGYTIYAGRNNVQNDALTFRIAHSEDTWLHVKAHHGSHVIIIGRDIPINVITFAAEIAAARSDAANSQKVEVDYTQRKNVRRTGEGLGLVNYSDYKTMLVTPNMHK